jgi:hypothetical protein
MVAGGCYKLLATVQRRRADNQKSEIRGQRSEVRWQRPAGEGRTGSHGEEVAQKATKRTKAGTEAEEFNAKA